MIRRPPRSTLSSSSAASDVYKRQVVVDGGLGEHGVVLHLGLADGGHVVGENNELGATLAEGGEGLGVSEAVLAGLHHKLDLGVDVVDLRLGLLVDGHFSVKTIKYRDPVLCVDTCLLYTSPSPRDS
eukprot:TRINITY_DN451_c0_g1_i3.p1 TRINITY_DN451_c0_g1~~TRINITY_DN451_c0_g1_i3.p1  ORF type:complete len:127 (+),score=21.37 TRINITY_DN451_c0_g1_i3:108-488(+)